MIRLTVRNKNDEVLDTVDWTDEDRRELVIGREPEVADLALQRGSISATHCRIRRTDSGAFELKDLDSTNGTYLNQREIQQTTLSDGDVIEVGDRRVDVEVTDSERSASADTSAEAPSEPEDVPPKQPNRERIELLFRLLRATGVVLVLGLSVLLFADRGGDDRSVRAEDLYDRMLSAHFRHHHETARSRLKELLRSHPGTPSAARAKKVGEKIRSITATRRQIQERYQRIVKKHRPSVDDSPSDIRSGLNALRSNLNVLWADRKSFLLSHPETSGPFENAPAMTDLLLKRKIWITRDGSRFWVRLDQYRQETLHKHLQRKWSTLQSRIENGAYRDALNRATTVEETFRKSWLHRKAQILVRRTRRSIASAFEDLFKKAGKHLVNGKLDAALNLYQSNRPSFSDVTELRDRLQTLIDQLKAHRSDANGSEQPSNQE